MKFHGCLFLRVHLMICQYCFWKSLGTKQALNNWCPVIHTCNGNLTIIGSDNGLAPSRCQAIIWTNDGILLIWTLRTNFNEILNEIHTFSFKKIHLKMSSAKWLQFCLSLNVLLSCCLNPSDKPSPETIWTKVFDAKWCQWPHWVN